MALKVKETKKIEIAIGSDMKIHLADVVVDELKKMRHKVEIFGALVKELTLWSQVAVNVAEKVSTGDYDQAVLFYWTGTGISLAENKHMFPLNHFNNHKQEKE